MKPNRIISKCHARVPLISCLIFFLLLNSCNEIGKHHFVASSKIKDLSTLGSFEFHPLKGDRELSREDKGDDIPGGEEPDVIPVSLPNKTAKTSQVADEFMEQLERIKVYDHQNVCSLDFPAMETRFVRIVIHEISTKTGTIIIDEFEVFGPDRKENLALASRGAVADVSSMAGGNKKEWLNDGIYGDGNASWYADVKTNAWMQIKLPGRSKVNRVTISRDRLGNSIDCIPKEFEVLLSKDGDQWTSVARWDPAMYGRFFSHPKFQIPVDQLSDKSWDGFLNYTFLRERSSWSRMTANDHLSPLVVERSALPNGKPYWGRIARLEPLERVLVLFEEMIERFDTKGLDVTNEQVLADKLRQKAKQESDSDALYLEVRQAKRDLFFRDPDLAPVQRVLFVKRHPYLETHNYSEHLDGILEPGGGVYVLNVPRDKQDRFRPEQAKIEQIFNGSKGVAREPVSDFDAGTIYFSYRPEKPEVEDWESYWHMYSLKTDGSGLKKLTDGPFHDFDGVCLPDGGLAFHSTRCKKRFICWRPQAYVLHRMESDGSDIQALSFANLTEWKPSVMQDGRILWTRSEYLDKGANFGHTLWAIRPDGTHPELVFGNNTPNCYSQAHEVPGTNEIVATLMTHGGHSGPIALIDRSRNKYDTDAITNITPDNRPFYEMARPAGNECEAFRDPYPISSDLFLVAHNPNQKKQHYGLYVMDRYGNRELLYADPGISSFFPSPLGVRQRPPVISGSLNADLKAKGLGQFIVQDVYMGLGSEVPRGKVKYIRVSEEVPSTLEKLSSGQYREDHEAYTEFYAAWNVNSIGQTYLTQTSNAPVNPLSTSYNWTDPSELPNPHVEEVKPGLYNVRESWGWPSYSAKASHGTVPVAEDGSANFLAPAGKVLYFHLLDAEHNEIQRMRSVIQLQPGEIRSCIGCHEDRQMAPPGNMGLSFEQEANHLEPDPWGTKPFSYQEIVQPVLNKNCIRCHDDSQTVRPVLTGKQDRHHIPASYRDLLEGGYIHYFDFGYGMRHFRAEPLSFGTLQSSLWTVLEESQHNEVTLEKSEIEALKTWTDLNCPLWPDYTPDRPVSIMYETADK